MWRLAKTHTHLQYDDAVHFEDYLKDIPQKRF